MFNILISQTAVKELKRMSKEDEKRIKKHILELGTDPFHKRSGVDLKKLQGHSNPEFFRLRIGDWTVIYTVDVKDVKITEIMRRGKGYSWLE